MSLFEHRDLPDRAMERVDLSRFKPFELMVLAIAKRGAPMSYEAIRARLLERGRNLSIQSLQKAWHGMPPLRKTAAGELELVPELDQFAYMQVVWKVEEQLGLAPRPKRLEPERPVPIDGQSPVTMDELRTASRIGLPWSVSSGRRFALALEASGRSMATDELGRTDAGATV